MTLHSLPHLRSALNSTNKCGEYIYIYLSRREKKKKHIYFQLLTTRNKTSDTIRATTILFSMPARWRSISSRRRASTSPVALSTLSSLVSAIKSRRASRAELSYALRYISRESSCKKTKKRNEMPSFVLIYGNARGENKRIFFIGGRSPSGANSENRSPRLQSDEYTSVC